MDGKFVSKQELENCSFIKTVLTLIVILYHSMCFWTGDWFTCIKMADSSRKIGAIALWLNSFHIYGFELCSGYIFSYLYYEEKRYNDYLKFVIQKVKRLIIPYMFVCTVWVMPVTQYFYHYDVTTLFRKFVIAINPSQLWFLWMLLDVFIIIWPLSKIIRNDVVAFIVAVIGFTVGLFGPRIIPNFFCMWTAFSYLPFFILGMKLREKVNWSLRKVSATLWIIMDVVLFVSWMFLSKQSGTVLKLLYVGVDFLLHAVGALMAFFVLQKIGRVFSGWKESIVFE